MGVAGTQPQQESLSPVASGRADNRRAVKTVLLVALAVNVAMSVLKLVIGLLLTIFAALETLPLLDRLRYSPFWLLVGGLLSGFFGDRKSTRLNSSHRT